MGKKYVIVQASSRKFHVHDEKGQRLTVRPLFKKETRVFIKALRGGSGPDLINDQAARFAMIQDRLKQPDMQLSPEGAKGQQDAAAFIKQIEASGDYKKFGDSTFIQYYYGADAPKNEYQSRWNSIVLPWLQQQYKEGQAAAQHYLATSGVSAEDVANYNSDLAQKNNNWWALGWDSITVPLYRAAEDKKHSPLSSFLDGFLAPIKLAQSAISGSALKPKPQAYVRAANFPPAAPVKK